MRHHFVLEPFAVTMLVVYTVFKIAWCLVKLTWLFVALLFNLAILLEAYMRNRKHGHARA